MPTDASKTVDRGAVASGTGCLLQGANASTIRGADNARTLENFAAAAARIRERPEPPPLVASTLLVPGYIDADEVRKIAGFIAGLDPKIPYALLGFHGDFLMTDLPPTSRQEAQRCLVAAGEAGLTRTRLGNLPILQ